MENIKKWIPLLILLCLCLFFFISASCQWMKEEPYEVLEDGWYGDGTYEVGKDIEKGRYYIKPKEGQISASLSVYGSDLVYEDIISQESWSFFLVEDGQTLEVTDGMFTVSSKIPPIEERGEGIYRVGYDIPAGEYTLRRTLEGEGYYCVYNEVMLSFFIIDNGFFKLEEQKVSAKRGDFLFVFNAEIIEISPF